MNYALSNFRPFAGTSVCRVSSPTGRFTPVTAALTVTHGGFSQTFTGSIRSGATNVPKAFVAILSPREHEADLVAGTISDAAGNYTVKVAPGSYMLVVVKSGYVYSFGTAPMLTIGTNATINTNLFLTAATRTIS